MSICTKCDYTLKNGPIYDALYCPNCGSTLEAGGSGGNAVVSAAAPRGKRLAAALIDVFISCIFIVVAFVPGINLLAALADTAFWLLRDIKGASPGKSMMGLDVRTAGGGRPTTAALMMRNLPFTPLIIQIVPIFGSLILPLMGVIMIVELVLILVSDRRLGDILAGTRVMQASTQMVRGAAGAAF